MMYTSVIGTCNKISLMNKSSHKRCYIVLLLCKIMLSILPVHNILNDKFVRMNVSSIFKQKQLDVFRRNFTKI